MGGLCASFTQILEDLYPPFIGRMDGEQCLVHRFHEFAALLQGEAVILAFEFVRQYLEGLVLARFLAQLQGVFQKGRIE